jgi:hypothetical protein
MNWSNNSSAASRAFSGAVIVTCTTSGCSRTFEIQKGAALLFTGDDRAHALDGFRSVT